ncbi:MAG TPA: hypothetical protein VMU59_15245 [Caulobacteraceae bacterium]|nr:hypothetical protein [Caulobacteraceae bacterium]
MTNTGSLTLAGGDAIGADLPHHQPNLAERKPPSRRASAQDPAPASQGQRLEIRQDPDSGAWIYTVTDRDTGEILAQHERDQVAQMATTPDYTAGALFKGRV